MTTEPDTELSTNLDELQLYVSASMKLSIRLATFINDNRKRLTPRQRYELDCILEDVVLMAQMTGIDDIAA